MNYYCYLSASKAVSLFFDDTVDVETGGIMIGEAAACEVGADAATGDVGSEFTAGEVASGIYSSL